MDEPAGIASGATSVILGCIFSLVPLVTEMVRSVGLFSNMETIPSSSTV